MRDQLGGAVIVQMEVKLPRTKVVRLERRGEYRGHQIGRICRTC